MESHCNFLHSLYSLLEKYLPPVIVHRDTGPKAFPFPPCLCKRKIFFLVPLGPKILERNICRYVKRKQGCLPESACKLLWQWYAAITQHIPHGTEGWISKLIKISAMKRPQTPAKNAARSLQKLSLQQLHAKTAEAEVQLFIMENDSKR